MHTSPLLVVVVVIFKMFIDLERERKEERERERHQWERNINWLPPICTPTRYWPCNLGMRSDWDQIPNLLVYRMMFQPTEPHWPGILCFCYFYTCFVICFYTLFLFHFLSSLPSSFQIPFSSFKKNASSFLLVMEIRWVPLTYRCFTKWFVTSICYILHLQILSLAHEGEEVVRSQCHQQIEY